MRLSDLIEPGDIVIGTKAPDIGAAAAQLLHETLPRHGFATSDIERIVAAVLEREREAPTSSGAIAIPHARDPRIQSFVAAIGINRDGIVDGAPMPRVMIAFASPESKRSEHLALLAALARFGSDNFTVASLIAARSVADVMKFLGALT